MFGPLERLWFHDGWIRRHSVIPLTCLTRYFYQHMSSISSVLPITHATRLTCRGHSLLRRILTPSSVVTVTSRFFDDLDEHTIFRAKFRFCLFNLFSCRYNIRDVWCCEKRSLCGDWGCSCWFFYGSGYFVDQSNIRIQDKRHFFLLLVVRNMSHCFCFLSCF
jgi:hypothetical protein